jgi:hypothetical protein
MIKLDQKILHDIFLTFLRGHCQRQDNGVAKLLVLSRDSREVTLKFLNEYPIAEIGSAVSIWNERDEKVDLPVELFTFLINNKTLTVTDVWISSSQHIPQINFTGLSKVLLVDGFMDDEVLRVIQNNSSTLKQLLNVPTNYFPRIPQMTLDVFSVDPEVKPGEITLNQITTNKFEYFSPLPFYPLPGEFMRFMKATEFILKVKRVLPQPETYKYLMKKQNFHTYRFTLLHEDFHGLELPIFLKQIKHCFPKLTNFDLIQERNYSFYCDKISYSDFVKHWQENVEVTLAQLKEETPKYRFATNYESYVQYEMEDHHSPPKRSDFRDYRAAMYMEGDYELYTFTREYDLSDKQQERKAHIAIQFRLLPADN